MTLRKTFEGDFKKMELTWGTAEREAKETFMEKKEQLHYPEWIDALKEEEEICAVSFLAKHDKIAPKSFSQNIINSYYHYFIEVA